MIIQADTRQKRKHHENKENYFRDQGIEIVHSKMLVGDYCIPSQGNVAVDTKGSVSELYSNLIQDHQRFHNECVLAQKAGIRLIILVENKDGIRGAEELKRWKNPQMFRYYKMRKKASAEGQKEPKPPASNIQLVKIIHSMSRDYGVEFIFCRPEEAGRLVVKLLTETEEE